MIWVDSVQVGTPVNKYGDPTYIPDSGKHLLLVEIALGDVFSK